jgi:hypothetical protein
MVMDKLAFQKDLRFSKSEHVDTSLEAEKKIARSFMGRIEWEMILIGLGQFTLTWVVSGSFLTV